MEEGDGKGERNVYVRRVKFTLDERRFGNTEQGVACDDVPLTLP